jgi:hypothetical protein
MTPEVMNPGFLDSTGEAIVNRQLEEGLNDVIKAIFTPEESRRIRAAVVDLTGSKLCRPSFAGFSANTPGDGGSLAKILAIYALLQLRFDVQWLATSEDIRSRTELLDRAHKLWAGAGVPRNVHPEAAWLLFLTERPGAPVQVEINWPAGRLVYCTARNCNWTASLLVSKLGIPFITSAVWQAGLLNRVRGGLWLTSGYCQERGKPCDTRTDHCMADAREPDCTFPGEMLRSFAQVLPTTPLSPHNVTALGVAVFYSLLAQGRLPDGDATGRFADAVDGACTYFWPRSLPNAIRIAAKCGRTVDAANRETELGHDGALVRRFVTLHNDYTIEYAVVLLTTGIKGKKTKFPRLLDSVDRLIQRLNPPPSPELRARSPRP